MKIYTKTGDKGKTSLIGGTRLPKHHIRIEAYGSVDELISYIGLIRVQDIDPENINTLINIQDKLMVCSSILATDHKNSKIKLPVLSEKDISELEKEIDKIDKKLPPLTSFILPGGHTIVAFCHITRSICRRAERVILKLSEEYHIPNQVSKYINRLSDFLFVLSRKLSMDLNAKEITWNPKL